MMTGNEIRKRFLEYFEKNGHKIVHSSPLLPANDPTLLFTNAGMNQFKDVFTGQEKRDYTRATSSQKCIRAGGKHNDLDEVGKTARHHTFFEMLGNFSFGDYFKEDAIKFAWDFLVNELNLAENRLWFSYFGGDEEVPADDEARDLWIKMGAKPDRVLPFGRKDNFWQMGDTGPCGPCSEIHYYMGDEPDNAEKNHPKYVNGEGDTTMEIWNLVFMQFERNEIEKGVFELTPLPAPSVDTGAGLERVAAVLQNKTNNYDTDLLLPIIEFTADLCGKQYESGIPESLTSTIISNDIEMKLFGNKKVPTKTELESFAMRVVADHARAATFAIADGILPGGKERNFVLKKIMQRAIYNGRKHLGFEDLFFHKICGFVVEQMKSAYPELEVQKDFIETIVRQQETKFINTLTNGLRELDNLLRKNGKNGSSFSELAKLKDTYGLEIDLMYIRLSEEENYVRLENEQGIPTKNFWVGKQLTVEKFTDYVEDAVKKLQTKSDIGKTKQAEKINPIYADLQNVGVRSNFHGYDKTEVEGAKVLALVKNDQKVDELGEGDEGLIVLDETPFYAESGGQVGDAGIISGQWTVDSGQKDNSALTTDHRPPTTIRVLDTFAPIAGIVLHKSKIEKGSIKVGDVVTATVDVAKRDATRRNHTATHLVHAALKEVLGTHVKQAGSVVAPNFLRFDFTHYQPISDAELTEIEDLVNREILKNDPVNTDLMSIEDAMRTGAMALFGEKYGAEVRVLSVGGGEFSKELCGGTHVRATGDIGSFKIMSDEAVASGVRRIRAITGIDAFERFREDEKLIAEAVQIAKAQRDNLPNAIEKLQEELKKAKRENDELKMKIATGAIGGESSNGDEAKEVNGVKVIAKTVEGLDKGGMRHLSDTLMAKIKSGVVIIAKAEDGKVSFIVRVSDDLTKKVSAGRIVQEIAPIVSGRGGGKPDMAEGGGTDASKLSEALDASYKSVEKMLI